MASPTNRPLLIANGLVVTPGHLAITRGVGAAITSSMDGDAAHNAVAADIRSPQRETGSGAHSTKGIPMPDQTTKWECDRCKVPPDQAR